MPRVKIDYVVSFSNEDPDNQASNLLSWEVSKKKWLCSPGEQSCSVVLQLARAVKISSVQIGAHHTALVEVLVGRSETPSEPFQVLVPRSVFLSPKESRGDEALDRVRSFDSGALAGDVCTQRWDRVRLVCSQPYNKHCKYGLSFIHIFEPEGAAPPPAPAPAPLRLLALDTVTSDDEEFRPGELFAKHRQSGGDTGAQIRQATSQALKNNPDAATKLMKTPLSKNKPTTSSDRSEPRDRRRDKDNLMYSKHEEVARQENTTRRHGDGTSRDEADAPRHQAKPNENDKVDKTPRSKRQEPSSSSNSESKRGRDRPDNKRKRDDNGRQRDRNEASSSRKTDESRKRPHSNRDRADDGSCSLRPGPESDEPLRGVVFVLSGYENPRRARLRDLALSLGAACQRDWGPTCTHLICAFENTPKLKAVRAARGGADVPAARGAWLEECGRRRRLLPWQWFAAERARRRTPPPASPSPPPPRGTSINQSESDTDDEIEKVLRQQRARAPALPADDEGEVQFVKDERIQGNITVEDSDSADSDAPTVAEEAPANAPRAGALPPMFEGRAFVLDEALAAPLDAQLLARYCVAYGGLVLTPSEVDPDSGSHYVLVGSLRAARDDSPRTSRALRVRADWVWACHARGALCPLDGYV